MESNEIMDYIAKRKQVEHNYNLIKENPQISLKEFQQKAIIDKE